MPASAGGGGQGGAAGASGSVGGSGEGGGTGAGACEPERLATDAKNCGVCGRDCRGAPCENGACQPELLAERLVSPYGIAVTDTHILWASPAKNITDGKAAAILSLSRSVLAGATPAPLFEGAAVRTRGFARAANGDLLWGDLEVGSILQRGSGGAQAKALATGRPNVNQLVVAGDAAYWSQGALDASIAEGGVYRSPLAGGAAEELAGMQRRPDALAVDGETIYWVNRGPDGQVMQANAGSVARVMERVDDPIAIAASGGHVAWAERTSGRVAVLAKGATTAVTLVRDASEPVEGIALSGDLLYRIVFCPADKLLLIKRSALDGAGEVLLARLAPVDAGYAKNPLGPFVLAFDDAYLYVADPGTLTFDGAGVPLSQQNGRLYRTAR